MKLEFLTCRYCGRSNFASAKALHQHHAKNAICFQKLQGDHTTNKSYYLASDFTKTTSVAETGMTKRIARMEAEFARVCIEDLKAWQKHMAKRQRKVVLDTTQVDNEQESDNDNDNTWGAEDDVDWADDQYEAVLHQNEGVNEENEVAPDELLKLPDVYIRGNFNKYVEYAQKKFTPFDTNVRDAISLLVVLRHSKASLETYEEVMEWHLRVLGKLLPHEQASGSPCFVSRDKLFRQLRNRYNYDKDSIKINPITLSYSKAKVKLVICDARKAIQSLLTDPRLRDEDYLFFGDDPFSAPPEDLNYFADLNTGLSYSETYKKLITKPGKQILLPVPMYIDGTATGQFADLPITPLKLSLGIFTRKARDAPHLWRTIGYVPAIPKGKSRGNRLLLQSGHCDGAMQYQDVLDDEGENDNIKGEKLQDLHDMLAILLEGFVDIQNKGFFWDFYYKGKLYENVEFVLYVPFIKCDTDEADKLCGSYSCRVGNVSQLCRYCKCPTKQADRCLANFDLKKKQEIQDLIDNNEEVALKNLSQKHIKNALHSLRFGAHSEMGVHGGCPIDMLHALLLGIFRYIRDCFFEQLGKTSKLAKDINSLSREYGSLFNRQSTRDLPKTSFAKGIQAGKIMAKEYTGILLVLAAVLQSAKGQHMVTTHKKSNFGKTAQLDDWILLVDTMLQWEAWLKSDRLEKNQVEQAEKKHRYIMYLIKKVGKRTTGMGLKIMKFHGIMHMAMDIRNFGVPLEVDTGSNESGHKPTKQAAKLTQKRQETFDPQVAVREEEYHLLKLAEQEILGRPLWDYRTGYKQEMKMELVTPAPITQGATFEVKQGFVPTEYQVILHSKIANANKMTLENELCKFITSLQKKVQKYTSKLYVRTEHKRNDQIFRAHPFYRGSVWRDWVVVDWADYGHLPNKLYGFVDLSFLPQDSRVNFGGIKRITPGVYAIVESTKYTTIESRFRQSELFRPLEKEVGKMEKGFVTKMKFYLADVEAFLEPACVIPNIGGPKNSYFHLKQRDLWPNDFVEWLEDDDVDYISDDEGADEEEQQTYEPDTDDDVQSGSEESDDDVSDEE